jgi:hypothetical protein
MERNLPATRTDPVDGVDAGTPLPPRQPISVAYLPLALVTFVILAFIIATWTFLAAGA